MKLLDENILKILLNRFPFNNKKYYNNQTSDSNILFTNNPKFYILKPKGKKAIYGLPIMKKIFNFINFYK